MTMLRCGAHALDLAQPRQMRILTDPPHSYSDRGRFPGREAALAQGRTLVAEGADILDVGGESTRPGAAPVSVQEELDRVIPVIEALAGELPVPLSVDTSKPEVMRAAVAAGAALINDVAALRRPGALAAAAETGAPVCLMHMQGEPGTMQQQPAYHDVVAEVRDFLAGRIAACAAAGIPRDRLLVDPGFGFGKPLAHNLALLRDLVGLQGLGVPVLAGLSRKSMIGALLDGAPVGERLYGSLAAAVLAVERGAAIVRAHDVAPTVQALRIVAAVREHAGN
jgi:dihydropteroate synthase